MTTKPRWTPAPLFKVITLQPKSQHHDESEIIKHSSVIHQMSPV